MVMLRDVIAAGDQVIVDIPLDRDALRAAVVKDQLSHTEPLTVLYIGLSNTLAITKQGGIWDVYFLNSTDLREVVCTAVSEGYLSLRELVTHITTEEYLSDEWSKEWVTNSATYSNDAGEARMIVAEMAAFRQIVEWLDD